MKFSLKDLPPKMREQAEKKLSAIPKRKTQQVTFSKGEEQLAHHLHVMGCPPPTREHRFDPERRWRFDFAWPERKVAVEVEGVLYGQQGRHQTPAGMRKDCEKYNAALRQGWDVYRYTTAMISDGSAAKEITRILVETSHREYDLD